MTRNSIRKHIILKDSKQNDYLEKFKKDGGFGSFLHMAVHSMMEASKKIYEGNHASDEITRIQNIVSNSHHSIHDQLLPT